MTPAQILTDLDAMGVTVSSPESGRLTLTAADGNVPQRAVEMARDHKQSLLDELADEIPEGWHLTAEGNMLRDDVEDWDDVDPDDVDVCPGCARYCDVATAFGEWRCSRCDKTAARRKEKTVRWLSRRDKILSRRSRR